MKNPDEIKRGLVEAIEEVSWVTEGGDAHDLIDACEKAPASMADAPAYIQQLEDHIGDITKKVERLETERDAAVSELTGTCQVCRWEETEKCASCHFNTDAWNVHESNWEWRGQPEPPKED